MSFAEEEGGGVGVSASSIPPRRLSGHRRLPSPPPSSSLRPRGQGFGGVGLERVLQFPDSAFRPSGPR